MAATRRSEQPKDGAPSVLRHATPTVHIHLQPDAFAPAPDSHPDATPPNREVVGGSREDRSERAIQLTTRALEAHARQHRAETSTRHVDTRRNRAPRDADLGEVRETGLAPTHGDRILERHPIVVDRREPRQRPLIVDPGEQFISEPVKDVDGSPVKTERRDNASQLRADMVLERDRPVAEPVLGLGLGEGDHDRRRLTAPDVGAVPRLAGSEHRQEQGSGPGSIDRSRDRRRSARIRMGSGFPGGEPTRSRH